MISLVSLMLTELEPLVCAPFYSTYLNLVGHSSIAEELKLSSETAIHFLNQIPESRYSHRYAEGKWSIAQVIQHCIDTEIIFHYRALTIAREPSLQDLPGFDENNYAEQSLVGYFTKSELINYLTSVRGTTLGTIRTMTDVQMRKIGRANGWDVQPLALFFCCSGHLRHHMNVIRERYL